MPNTCWMEISRSIYTLSKWLKNWGERIGCNPMKTINQTCHFARLKIKAYVDWIFHLGINYTVTLVWPKFMSHSKFYNLGIIVYFNHYITASEDMRKQNRSYCKVPTDQSLLGAMSYSAVVWQQRLPSEHPEEKCELSWKVCLEGNKNPRCIVRFCNSSCCNTEMWF